MDGSRTLPIQAMYSIHGPYLAPCGEQHGENQETDATLHRGAIRFDADASSCYQYELRVVQSWTPEALEVGAVKNGAERRPNAFESRLARVTGSAQKTRLRHGSQKTFAEALWSGVRGDET